MDKTIENKFFEAFKQGGVVGKGIYWMRGIYNLSEYFRPDTLENDKTPEDEGRYKRLQAEILEAVEAFDDSVIMGDSSPLMNEIEANLSECTTDVQRNRYVYSLLMPFGSTTTGCGIADICNPIGEIECCKKSIERLEKEIDDLQCSTDREGQLVPPEQMRKALEKCIHNLEERSEWATEVCDKFGEYLFCSNVEEGSVEYCMKYFIDVMERYANRLDALLLTFGIDLLRVQKDCGVYLKDERQIDEISFYIGNRELTQKYIDALPKDPQQDNNKSDSLNTDRARKYFARAVEVGYMKPTDTGYKWTFGGKVRLGYFLVKVLCPTNTEKIPQRAVSKLFGVDRVDSAIAQINNVKKPQKWRAVIDSNIFFD